MELARTKCESRIRFYSHLPHYWDEVKPKPGEIGRVFCKEHKYLRYGDNDGDSYTKERKKARRASA